MTRDPAEEFAVELTHEEIRMLVHGFEMWFEPGHATEGIARVIGYRSVLELRSFGAQLGEQIQQRAILSRVDWSRAITSLEMNFVGDEGAGLEWSVVSGYPDSVSLQVLRRIQSKLSGVRLRHGDLESSV